MCGKARNEYRPSLGSHPLRPGIARKPPLEQQGEALESAALRRGTFYCYFLWLIKETWTTREGCCAVFEGKLRPSAAFCSFEIKTIIPRSQSLASKRNFLFKNLRLPAQPFCLDSRQRTQTYFPYVKDDNAEPGQKGEPGAAHHPFLVV